MLLCIAALGLMVTFLLSLSNSAEFQCIDDPIGKYLLCMFFFLFFFFPSPGSQCCTLALLLGYAGQQPQDLSMLNDQHMSLRPHAEPLSVAVTSGKEKVDSKYSQGSRRGYAASHISYLYSHPNPSSSQQLHGGSHLQTVRDLTSVKMSQV